MSWHTWKLDLLSYFAANKDNVYSSSTIDAADHIILLKDIAGANQYDRLISIADLISSIETGETPYGTYSVLNPTTIGSPDAGKAFVGFYSGYFWTKQSTGMITIVNSQMKSSEVPNQGTPGDPTEINFSPYYPDVNGRVEVNGSWANPNMYTILGTKVTFTYGLNQYDLVTVTGSFSYFA